MSNFDITVNPDHMILQNREVTIKVGMTKEKMLQLAGILAYYATEGSHEFKQPQSKTFILRSPQVNAVVRAISEKAAKAALAEYEGEDLHSTLDKDKLFVQEIDPEITGVIGYFPS